MQQSKRRKTTHEIDGSRPDAPQLGATAETAHASVLSYIDEYQQLGLRIESDRPAKIWRMPIHTVSLSEGGFEKVFQGNCSLFVFQKALASGEELSLKFDIYAGPLEKMKRNDSSRRETANKL